MTGAASFRRVLGGKQAESLARILDASQQAFGDSTR